jgi:hypothetical protein
MIWNINPNTPDATSTTIAHIHIKITGSNTLDRLFIVTFNSSWYMFSTFMREASRFAVSSQTFINTVTLLGIKVFSSLIESYIFAHFCNHQRTLSIISWYAGIHSTSLNVLNVSI